MATNGAQSDRDALSPTMSDDGGRASFLSDATTLDASPAPLPCDAGLFLCTRVFVRTVASATTARLGFTAELPGVTGVISQAYRVMEGVISANGASRAVVIAGSYTTANTTIAVQAFGAYAFAPDPPTAADVFGSTPTVAPGLTSIAADPTGRFRGYCFGDTPTSFCVGVFDMQTWVTGATPPGTQPDCTSVSFSADGLTVFFASSGGSLVAGDTNGASDVFAVDLDADDDGMSAGWESVFRFSDLTAADGSLDADNNGVTNQQEFVAGTNPRGLFKYYLAEGALNAFFNTEINVF